MTKNYEAIIEKSEQRRYYLGENSKYYLTTREYEVARELLMHNGTSKAIGNFLNLSSRTVEFYLNSLRLKLDAATREELRQKLLGLRDLLGI